MGGCFGWWEGWLNEDNVRRAEVRWHQQGPVEQVLGVSEVKIE